MGRRFGWAGFQARSISNGVNCSIRIRRRSSQQTSCMLSSRRGASPLNTRSTLIDTAVRGRRSRRSCSGFSAMIKRGPMLGLTANGPARKIRRWSLGRLGRADLYFERDTTILSRLSTIASHATSASSPARPQPLYSPQSRSQSHPIWKWYPVLESPDF